MHMDVLVEMIQEYIQAKELQRMSYPYRTHVSRHTCSVYQKDGCACSPINSYHRSCWWCYHSRLSCVFVRSKWLYSSSSCSCVSAWRFALLLGCYMLYYHHELLIFQISIVNLIRYTQQVGCIYTTVVVGQEQLRMKYRQRVVHGACPRFTFSVLFCCAVLGSVFFFLGSSDANQKKVELFALCIFRHLLLAWY